MRIAVGVGAWLLGVGAATGGSLLAVSLLGQGIAANNSQQLTAAAVSRALASETSDPPNQGTATLPSATMAQLARGANLAISAPASSRTPGPIRIE